MAHFEEENKQISTRVLLQYEPWFVVVWGRGPNHEPLHVYPQRSNGPNTDVVASRDTDLDPLHVRWKIWAGAQTGPIELVAKRPNGIIEATMTLNVTAIQDPKRRFVLKLVREGGETARLWGLPVSLMLAQACHECGYGGRATASNILFGIGSPEDFDKRTHAPIVRRNWFYCPTVASERTNIAKSTEQKKYVTDFFCAAKTYEEAVHIWASYVVGHPKHDQDGSLKSKFTVGRKWSEGELRQLANLMHTRLGFGADHDYGSKLMMIWKELNLAQYDRFFWYI